MKKEKNLQTSEQVKVKKSSNFFKSFFGKIADFFRQLIPLVMMQFKDQKDFSHYKKKRQIFFRMVYAILIFVAITYIIKIMFSLIVTFGIFSFIATFNFRAYLVLMTVLFVFSFISCLVKVTNTLYFAKDNSVLITLPVKNSLIFTSKLIVCFIYELIKNTSYILPFFFAYGMVMSLPITFYLYAVGSLVLFTLLSTIVAGLLSIPAMCIAIVFKRNKILEYISVAVVVTALVYILVKLFGAIPQNIDLVRDWGKIYWAIQDFLAQFAKIFFIFDYLLQLFTGMVYNGMVFNPFTATNFVTLQICFGIMLLSLVLIYLLSKPLFLKMISSPFEYKKKLNLKGLKNRKHSPFVSSVNQQVKRAFRTPKFLYSVVAVAIITPLAVFLQNKIIGAMDTRLFGNNMGVTFNILMIALLTLASNYHISTIYSREGNSAYLNKINPVPYYIPLSAKVVFNATLNCVSIIVSCTIINIFAKIGVFNTILLSLGLILLYLAHLFWSAELDIMNPQNQHYQTTGEHNKNPNERKSTLYAFIASAVFALFAFLFMGEYSPNVYLKLFFGAALFFALRTYLYFSKIKLYYKEK